MVRGRRVRAAKTGDEVSYASPKRKDSRLENIGYLANGADIVKPVNGELPKVPSPPTTRSRNHTLSKADKSVLNNGKLIKNTHITNYFHVVSPVNSIEDSRISKIPINLKQESLNGNLQPLFDGTRIEDRDYSEQNGFHTFGMDRYMGFDEISKIIHTVNDRKKDILNNIFKKQHCVTHRDDEASIKIKDEKFEEEDEVMFANGFTQPKSENGFHLSGDSESCEGGSDLVSENNDDGQPPLPNVRLSPRKHASTLQRCVTVKENVKTPHRIRLCEAVPQLPSHSLQQLSIKPYRKRTRRRLSVKSHDDASSSDSSQTHNGHGFLSDTLSVKSETENTISGALSMTVRCVPTSELTLTPEIKVKKELKDVKHINGVTSHKLTEYFPVRRSVRKTKKEVLEEKQRDLEMAIREEREEGLEVATFEGKGRGVIAARQFCRGEFVVEYAGELVSMAEARAREARYAQDTNKGCYMYYFRHNNHQYCIDATAESGRLGRLVNHSRNGNLVTKAVFFDAQPHLVLLAGQDIAPGEEVTYDYGDRSREALQHHPWLAL